MQRCGLARPGAHGRRSPFSPHPGVAYSANGPPERPLPDSVLSRYQPPVRCLNKPRSKYNAESILGTRVVSTPRQGVHLCCFSWNWRIGPFELYRFEKIIACPGALLQFVQSCVFRWLWRRMMHVEDRHGLGELQELARRAKDPRVRIRLQPGATVYAWVRVSRNHLLETLTLGPQGPSRTAQGNALGAVRATRNQAL